MFPTDMDPEARVYFVLVLVLAAAFLVAALGAIRCLAVADRHEERAMLAEAMLAEYQQRHRASIDDHFGQTPSARHAADDTLVMNGYGFRVAP